MKANTIVPKPGPHRENTKLRGQAIVRTLVEHLEFYERKQNFLREIDRKIILIESKDLDAIFKFVCDTLKWLLRVSDVHFYVAQEGRYLLSCTTADRNHPVPTTLDKAFLAEHCEIHHEGTQVFDVSRCESVSGPFAGLSFLAAKVHGTLDEEFGCIVLESAQEKKYSLLDDKDTCTFVNAVAGQVSVAITYRREEQKNRLVWSVVQD